MKLYCACGETWGNCYCDDNPFKKKPCKHNRYAENAKRRECLDCDKSVNLGDAGWKQAWKDAEND